MGAAPAGADQRLRPGRDPDDARTIEHERGCLPEERVLNGDLTYHSSMERLDGDEERFVLLAMHQTLVERGLCLRSTRTKGRC